MSRSKLVLSLDWDWWWPGDSCSHCGRCRVYGYDRDDDSRLGLLRDKLAKPRRHVFSSPGAVLGVLKQSAGVRRIIVSESHAELYSVLRRRKTVSVVLDLDEHVDFNDWSSRLTCGNWITKLVEESRLGAVISPRDDQIIPGQSLDAVPFWAAAPRHGPGAAETWIEEWKKYSETRGIDTVFVCKSSPYTDPRGDSEFNAFLSALNDIRPIQFIGHRKEELRHDFISQQIRTPTQHCSA